MYLLEAWTRLGGSERDTLAACTSLETAIALAWQHLQTHPPGRDARGKHTKHREYCVRELPFDVLAVHSPTTRGSWLYAADHIEFYRGRAPDSLEEMTEWGWDFTRAQPRYALSESGKLISLDW